MPDPPPLLIVAPVLAVVGSAMDRAGEPSAEAVALAGGRIVAVGSRAGCAAALPSGARVIEAPGARLLAGFIDAHVHVLAAVAAAQGVDCSPHSVDSIAQLLEAIADAVAEEGPGTWVRATGYEETMLREARHPTRAELDRVAPRHPVRLIHRSGHAEVLNSVALAACGIDEATPEPPHAVIGRSLDDGRLDGLLIGMTDTIEAAMPAAPAESMAEPLREWAATQAAAGVTTLVDASASTTPARWSAFVRWIEEGALPQQLILMEPAWACGSLPAAGAEGRIMRGESKLRPAALEGDAPAVDELASRLRPALERGRRVAVHAPTPTLVRATLEALSQAGAPPGQRLEHAPLLDASLRAAVAQASAFVVAQPGLLNEVTPRYEALLTAEERAILHPWRSAMDKGIRVAFSSDAPVSRSTPLEAAAAASSRRPATLAPHEALAPAEALRAWTAGAAEACGLEDRGRIADGLRADLVVVDGPVTTDPARSRVLITIIGGTLVHEAPRREQDAEV